jgi:uncharacterized surface protein with fasciclin (FAS1) repeats
MAYGETTTQNILETARAAGTFTTLLAAIERAGLTPTLADDGPFTVFAPPDEAFSELPDGAVESLLAEPDTLASVVTYHLVPGRLPLSEVAYLRRASTLQGETLRLSLDGEVHVDGARLIDADIEASNGLIHVIDRVLLPAQI